MIVIPHLLSPILNVLLSIFFILTATVPGRQKPTEFSIVYKWVTK
jgi:hypothetical protein